MKKFAKLLAMVLAVSMVLTMFVGAVDYKDAASITEGKEDAIQAVYDYGVMQGNEKGEFNPQGKLTRDEMAKIMYALTKEGLLTDENQKAENAKYASLVGMFTDYASDTDNELPGWSKGYVGYAYAADIFVGDGNNAFNPLNTLMYADAAIVLLRALELEGTYDDPADDTTVRVPEYTGSMWYENAVKDAVLEGLFTGLDIREYRDAISREDVAVMIANAIAKQYDETTKTHSKFILSTIKTGVVTGVEEIEKVNYFVMNGVKGAKAYKVGDLKLADYIGKEVSWSEESKSISDLTVLTKASATVKLGDIKLDSKGEKLSIGEIELKYADVKDADAYLFIETEKELTKMSDVKTLVAAATADSTPKWQEVTVVLNTGSISVFDAGVKFVEFDEDCVDITPEYKDKAWVFNYTYEFEDKVYTITKEMSEIEDGTYLAVKVIDGAVEIVGYPEVISMEKVAVTDTKAGKVYKVNGETVVLYDAFNTLTAAPLYEAQGQKTYKDPANAEAKECTVSVVVYNGMIIKYVAEEVKPAPAEKPVYGIVIDWAINPATIKDKDKKDVNVNLVSVAIVVDGVTKTIKVVDTDAYVPATGVFQITADATNYDEAEEIMVLTAAESGTPALITEYKVSDDGKKVTFKTGTEYKDKEIGKDFTFVDMSGNNYTAADLSIDDKYGIVTIGGRYADEDSVLLVRLGVKDGSETLLVIFDDNEKVEDRFGVYGKLN